MKNAGHDQLPPIFESTCVLLSRKKPQQRGEFELGAVDPNIEEYSERKTDGREKPRKVSRPFGSGAK